MADAKLFAITGFGGGVSVGVQADTAEEFQALVQSVRSNLLGDPVLAQLFAPVVGVLPTDEAQAIATIQAAIPGTVVQPVSTVGQPLPQPTVVAQPVAQPAAPVASNPPTTYPGDCAHGARQYKDSLARGKAWRRWECAIPWSKGVQGRCDSVNVEG